MSFFSLSWFKSEKQKELEKLKIEEQQIKNEILKKELDSFTQQVENTQKPYKNIKMVNKSLTIVLNDGNVLTKLNATPDDFNKARECKTEACLFSLVGDPQIVSEIEKEKKEYEKIEKILNSFDVLNNLKDFLVVGNSVYLSGIDRTLQRYPLPVYAYDGQYAADGKTGEKFFRET